MTLINSDRLQVGALTLLTLAGSGCKAPQLDDAPLFPAGQELSEALPSELELPQQCGLFVKPQEIVELLKPLVTPHLDSVYAVDGRCSAGLMRLWLPQDLEIGVEGEVMADFYPAR
ncbi:MAG: hypothetical protein KDD55_10590, partial [Bdellovibrionales bacterium]|nr:hypothetical protein [Bdellovibrionales bacterium]